MEAFDIRWNLAVVKPDGRFTNTSILYADRKTWRRKNTDTYLDT